MGQRVSDINCYCIFPDVFLYINICNLFVISVKQIEDYKTRKQEEDHEFSKPMARYADDSDLDALLKSKDRDGDPMLEYLRSKQSSKESGKPGMCNFLLLQNVDIITIFFYNDLRKSI